MHGNGNENVVQYIEVDGFSFGVLVGEPKWKYLVEFRVGAGEIVRSRVEEVLWRPAQGPRAKPDDECDWSKE